MREALQPARAPGVEAGVGSEQELGRRVVFITEGSMDGLVVQAVRKGFQDFRSGWCIVG